MARSAAASSPRWRARSARFRWASARHGWSRSAVSQRSFGLGELAASELERASFDVRFGPRRAHVEALLHLDEGALERGTRARRQLRDGHARERLGRGDAHRADAVLERGQEQGRALLRRELRRAEHGSVDHERLGTGERRTQRLERFLARGSARDVRAPWRARWREPRRPRRASEARGAHRARLCDPCRAHRRNAFASCDAGNHLATQSRAQVADSFAWQPLHAFGVPNATL